MRNNLRAFILAASFGLIALVTATCGGGGGSGGSNGDDPVPDKVSDAVVYVEDELAGVQLSDTIGGVYTYDYTGTPPDINAGDILLSGEGHGYLRKVTTVNDTGTQVLVGTTQGTLDEAFENLTVDRTVSLTPGGVQSQQAMQQGVFLSPQMVGSQLADQFYIAIDDVVIHDQDGDTATKNDQVVMNGSVTLEPDINFQTRIRWFTLKYLKFTVTMNETVNVKVSSKVELVGYHKKIELARYYFTPIYIQAGPVPVVLAPVLTVNVGFDGQISVSVTTEVTQSATLTGGLKYENQNWGIISDFNNSFDFVPPTLSYECSAKGYAGAQVNLMIYGVVGPYANANGYMLLEADPFATPWWDLYVGLEANGGVKIEVLSHVVAGYEATIIDWDTIIASAPMTCTDSDNDGYYAESGCGTDVDCDDGDSLAYPGAPEICDGQDNQCPGDAGYGSVDEGCVSCNDVDGDGYYAESGCGTDVDCDDGDSLVYPGAPEICDGQDNQCPGDAGYGETDEGGVCGGSTVGMALVPSGCFDMGDAFNEGGSDELPVHNVCITSAFYMDVHEVTNSEYAACVSGGGCTAPGYSSSYTRGSYYGNSAYDNFPVIYVDWNQSAAYCAWAGKRLPTEAEWEYAARGGLSGKRYPWGDSISCSDACYGRWSSSYDCWDYNGLDNDTHHVESYNANGYGLYDMAGNVFEWTNDWYQSDYYGSSPTNDPPGPASGTSRVLRGGYWDTLTSYLRVAYRGGPTPIILSYNIGFRCAGD